jgi:aminoglycoside phosphotransferase family enzyme
MPMRVKGSGDLQAYDIFCLDDGIRIFDCLEFSDRMRYCDTTADVALPPQ